MAKPHAGVSAGDVERAADALLRAGERPTIEKVREKLGTGSPNTIHPLLDAWWKRLSARLDAGPAALHRLPESVAHAAEALWMQALDEGRRRAALEQHATTRALATDKQTVEVRSHVLSPSRERTRIATARSRTAANRTRNSATGPNHLPQKGTGHARRPGPSDFGLEDQLSVLAPREAPSQRKSRKPARHPRAASHTRRRRQRGLRIDELD